MTSYVGTTFHHITGYSDGLTGGSFGETFITFAIPLPSTSAGDLLFFVVSPEGSGEEYFSLYPGDPDFGFDTGAGQPREFASRLCDGSESGATLHWTRKELTDPFIVGANYDPTYPRLFAVMQYDSLAAPTPVGQAWAGLDISPFVFGQVDFEGVATEMSWVAVSRPRTYFVLSGTGVATPVVTSYSWSNATDRGSDTLNTSIRVGGGGDFSTQFIYVADVLDDTSMVSGPASPTPAVDYAATFYNPLSGNPSDPGHTIFGNLYDFAVIVVPPPPPPPPPPPGSGEAAAAVEGYWGVLIS